ncbi:MbnP family protein [Hyalangium minutum]|uniref:Copper-binding protein MbnP-like domain-containing protein n=1 Tax=Hyalangium minutum TaxID=394096 RepID=A0A085WGT3_9BACT|nr:MbnP family protein [Hyalangium minutum]KFE66896.1 hypothetical protein DB31_9110 [Hyalangium minutum]
MKTSLFSSVSLGRALGLALISCILLAACGEDSPRQGTLSPEEQKALEQQVTDLESEVTRLEGQILQWQQEHEDAQNTQAQLIAQVNTLRQQLDEARRLLESQDWQGVLVQLESARSELQGLTARLAATDGSLELYAALAFGPEPFELDRSYFTAGGDTITFTELRYWLSNIRLVKQDGSQVPLPGSYYLMEVLKEQAVEGTNESETLPANRRERVQVSAVPAGVYTGILFSVGVDPTYNDDLSRQAGELHVLKNMTSISWMWFTSYIFTKTQGRYLKADGATDSFAWETGSNANYRTVQKSFPAPITVNSQKRLHVNLRADVSALFAALSPRTTPTISASHTAERATLSDSYSSMFSLVSVENPSR